MLCVKMAKSWEELSGPVFFQRVGDRSPRSIADRPKFVRQLRTFTLNFQGNLTVKDSVGVYSETSEVT